MKIRKSKKYKIIFLCAGCIITAVAALIITMTIKYINRPYVKAEKLIERVCKKEGLSILFTDENVAKKEYLSGQAGLNEYGWLNMLSDIIFLDATSMYSMVNDDSIGAFIKNVEIEENGNNETYEVYEIKNISSEYMAAIKAPEDGKYIGILIQNIYEVIFWEGIKSILIRSRKVIEIVI